MICGWISYSTTIYKHYLFRAMFLPIYYIYHSWKNYEKEVVLTLSASYMDE